MSDQVWQKFLDYLKGLEPRVYIPKGVRVLTQEALRAAPEDVRLQALEQVFSIIARPEPKSNTTKFEF